MSKTSPRTIRILARVVSLLVLAGVIAAVFVKIWLGAILAVLWLLLGDFLPMALLAPFFGAGWVRDAMLGPMVAEPPELGPPRPALDDLVGARGEVIRDLDPEGLVQIGDQRHTAHSEDGVLAAGVRIEVVGTRLDHLVVAKADRVGS